MHFVSLQLEGLVAVFVCYDQQFFLLSTREIATGFIFIYLLPSMIHQYEGLEKNSCSNCSFLPVKPTETGEKPHGELSKIMDCVLCMCHDEKHLVIHWMIGNKSLSLSLSLCELITT
jgi:hypothetical protein